MQYLGIAADEPERIKRHSVPGKVLPLVDIGWNEAYCREWCEENDLLSPISNQTGIQYTILKSVSKQKMTVKFLQIENSDGK